MNKHELYYQIAKSHLEDQDQRNREIQSKSIRLAQFAILTASAGIVLLQDFNGVQSTPIAWIGIGVSLTFFAAAMIATGMIVQIKGWIRNPSARSVAVHVKDDDITDDGLTKWTADAITDSIERNEQIIQSKSCWFNLEMLSLALLVLSIGIFAIVARI